MTVMAVMTVTHRDEQARSGSKYIPVLVWRINSVEQMAWLMCQGVDGEEGSEKILFSWDCSHKGGRGKALRKFCFFLHGNVHVKEGGVVCLLILISLFHSPGQ